MATWPSKVRQGKFGMTWTAAKLGMEMPDIEQPHGLAKSQNDIIQFWNLTLIQECFVLEWSLDADMEAAWATVVDRSFVP